MEIIGKNGICKIFTDNVEPEAMKQIYNIMSSPISENTNIAFMPDVHAGKGCPIGLTKLVNKDNPRICPNLIGVDIGCSISGIKIACDKFNSEEFDKFVKTVIPMGHSYRDKAISKNLISKNILTKFVDAERLIYEDGDKIIMKNNIVSQLASLGGGNHFIEVGKEGSSYWLFIHSGSRFLGKTVAEIYQRKAIEYIQTGCEKDLMYLDKDSKYLDRYLTCVDACQEFAQLSHSLIFSELLSYFDKYVIEDKITTMHNYIDLDTMIMRKGAVRANKGEKLLIPFNMRDGVLICTGLGNPHANYSAPHGAGRVMSRAKAKANLNLEDVKIDMKNNNVYTSSLDHALDEAPDAYKDCKEIIGNIKDLVEINETIKPILNIKGGK